MPSPSDTTSKAKIEALRAEEQRKTRTRRVLLVVTVAVIGAVLLGVAALASRGHDGSASATRMPVAATGAGLPPWPAPADPQPLIKAAGLVANPMEGAVQHFHAHVDIIVDGKAQTVAPEVGIDRPHALIAELHTHDDTGILHVESGSPTDVFTLGQAFVEWNVRLDETHLGGLTAGGGKTLRAYVNGAPVAGDPAAIKLAEHQEIALVFGSGTPATVPSTYDWKAHNV